MSRRGWCMPLAAGGSVIAVLVAAAVVLGAGPREVASRSAAASVPAGPEQIARGAYLATLGNCAGCHTRPGGEPYAGGRGLPTPFGTVYAGNLTPDDTTGLGRWSADDFWRALHEGRSRDGRHLVPAFPYASFTHVVRDDSDALFAYLRSLPPVQRANTPHGLRFPYNTELAMAAWQWLHFTPADPAASATWSRGAYLVQGLGHCAACHAPRNALGATSGELSGGQVAGQAWYAPSLHPAAGRGDAAELAALLRDGRTDRDSLSGPMASVVYRSLQHWHADDLQAVADHLAGLPARPATAETPPPAPTSVLALGRRLYDKRCADCHGERGQGAAGAYPALAGNPTVLQPTARNLVQVMREGGFAPATAGHPRPYGMPPQDLSNAELAAMASYVRQSWGNRASAVSELQVMQLR